MRLRQHDTVLPGFGLSLGISVLYLSAVVLVPLGTLLAVVLQGSWSSFWHTVTEPRLIASYKLSFGLSLLSALFNALFGLMAAWVLVRYRFVGKRALDALIDLPFALPTAVAGIALAAIYAPDGWLGQWFARAGIKVAFTPIGIWVAMVFTGLPFVVRTLQPVMEDMDRELEEAAASLGANRLQIWLHVVLPFVFPAMVTGFAMAFARALGEYGSVIFIAGNIPFVSEIVPLQIVSKLEQFDYAGATAIAVVMLAASFVMLYVINHLQRWASVSQRAG